MGSTYDGMEGGADPCGSRGGGPDVRLGTYDGDGDEGKGGGAGSAGDPDYGGAGGMGGDLVPPAGTSTANEPRPEEWIK